MTVGTARNVLAEVFCEQASAHVVVVARTCWPSTSRRYRYELARRQRRQRRSDRIARAALWPGAPVTPPPGMRARAAVVEARHRAAIVGIAEHRPRPEQLVERERAVEDVAAGEPEGLLEVERAQRLAADHARLEARRIAIDRVDHQVGHLVAMVVPGAAVRQFAARRAGRTGSPHGRPCGARLSSSVEGISISMIGSRLQPCWRASRIGAVHVGEARRHDDAGGVVVGDARCPAAP